MTTRFAAVLYPTERVPDAALSRGFAVPLAGWDVPAAHLLVADIPGLKGWSAAFYQSGLRDRDEAFDHAVELFDDDPSPGACVWELTGDLELVVYAIAFTDALLHDDAVRFRQDGITRRYARDGQEGVEVGGEDKGEGSSELLDAETAPGGSASELRASLLRAALAHRGSTFLSQELGIAATSALVGALYAADRKVAIHLVQPEAASIAEQVAELDRTLGRQQGRGSSGMPSSVAGVSTPEVMKRFAAAYDWQDPADPVDLYRDITIGELEGTLRFFRDEDWELLQVDIDWKPFALKGYFPIARMVDPSESVRKGSVVALAADAENLRLVGSFGIEREAGPTLGELILYLALGWRKRTAIQEELVQALMLRAKLRAG